MNINFEFRKGILFIRLLGNLTKDNYIKNRKNLNSLINIGGIKYVVFNLDNIKALDAYGIKYLLLFNKKIKEDNGHMFICSNNCFKNKFQHRVTILNNEIEALNVI